MNRFLLFGLFFLLAANLFACSPADEITAPTQGAVPVSAVASQVSANLTAAVPTPAPTSMSAAPANPGLLVVYEKSGNLWAWTDGGITQITNGRSDSRPQLSKDGKLVAFRRGAELWVVDATGQNPRKLYAEAGAAPNQFEFAPNSHKIYFTSAASDGASRFDLNVADADAVTVKTLLPAGQGGEFTFLANGSQLALVQPEKIITARMDGTGAQVVYKFAEIEGAKGDYLPHITWMDNGYGFKTVIPGNPTRFMFVPAAGGQPAQLAEFRAVAPSVSDTYIAPDGSKLMYLKQQGGNLELHVIDASTADKAYFAYERSKLGILGWTADSKNILFWVDDPRSTWMAAGNDRSPLSDVAFAANIVWVNRDSFVFLNESELRLRTLGQPSQIIDSGVSGEFDAIEVR